MGLDGGYIDPEFLKEEEFMKQFPDELVVSLGEYSVVFHEDDRCKGLQKAFEIKIVKKYEALLMGRRPCEYCWPDFHWQNQYRESSPSSKGRTDNASPGSSAESEVNFDELIVPAFEVGQKVTIIAGPFSTLPAEILQMDFNKQKAVAKVELFGLEIPVDVGFSEVGPFFES